jgi:hypothetical protein
VPRASVVNARRPGHRPGRSEAESIDDAEHGASIIGAMVTRLDLTTELACVLQQNVGCTRTDFCGTHSRPSELGSDRADMHIGGAILRHELDTRTATADTTNDGVNDPVRARWGQAPGTTAGSFTPSLVQ